MKKKHIIFIVIWLILFLWAIFNLLRLVAAHSEVQVELNRAQLELTELQAEVSSSNALYLGEFKITYYDACVSCCGKTDGITKSGAKVCEGVTVAVDPSVIPLGTYIYIEDIGYRVAQDTGSAIKGNKIDVYVCSHSQAWELGVLNNVNVWRMM